MFDGGFTPQPELVALSHGAERSACSRSPGPSERPQPSGWASSAARGDSSCTLPAYFQVPRRRHRTPARRARERRGHGGRQSLAAGGQLAQPAPVPGVPPHAGRTERTGVSTTWRAASASSAARSRRRCRSTAICTGSSPPWRCARVTRWTKCAVPQHPNDARTRLYGPGVYVRRLLDIATFFFLAKFTEKPLRFFGLVGSVSFVIGAVTCLVLAGRQARRPGHRQPAAYCCSRVLLCRPGGPADGSRARG